MSDNHGESILKGLTETRKFFEQVSLLVKTAGDLLEENRWDSPFGNKSSNVTSHLASPKEWMPRSVCRYFVVCEDSDDYKDLLVTISVILDQEKAWTGFKEPWMTCGVFRFQSGKSPRKDWSWSCNLQNTHLVESREADGSFSDYEYSAEEQQDWGGILKESTMAVPLVDITSAEDLRTKFINPLLNKIETDFKVAI